MGLGPVWAGGKSHPHWDSIPDRPARSQSLYRLSYTAHTISDCTFIYSSRSLRHVSAYNYGHRRVVLQLNEGKN